MLLGNNQQLVPLTRDVFFCADDFRVIILPHYILINMFWWITGLEKVWDVKPLINGKDVMKVLQLKGGPVVKEWVTYCIISPKWCSVCLQI